MENQRWLERVSLELARRRVPADQSARLLQELGDHLDDLTEGGRVMSQQVLDSTLGSPDVVVDSAVQEYRQVGWVRRHPILVFGVAPLPAAVVLLAGYLLLGAGVAWCFGKLFSDEMLLNRYRTVTGQAILTFSYTVGFVPFVLGAWWFGRMAIRHRLSGWWLTIATAQIAFVGWLVFTGVSLSDVPGKSSFSLGLMFPPWQGITSWSSLVQSSVGRQMLQLILPLAVGMICLRTKLREAESA